MNLRIFLSAVSSQFKDCRDALASDLRAVGAEVVVQEDFQQHGRTLLEKLETYIAGCDRVIALVGDAYGWEPEPEARPAGLPRRSYAQWEYFFAQGDRLDGSRQPTKDTFVYFATHDYLARFPVAQPADATQLQQDFTAAIRRSGKDRNPFGSADELRALVLRDGIRLREEDARGGDLAFETCRSQVLDHMRPLLGSRSDLSRNFVPELHVQRRAFKEEIRRFYQCRAPGFLLLGESGIGKTSSLCALTLSLIEEKRPVLFFRGITLESGLETAIATEFNWTFTEQQTFIEIARRLEGLRLKQPLTIVIDAIDEWPYERRVQNLVLILRHTEPSVMRFIISCKTESWAPFTRQLGSPTDIEAFLATAAISEPEQSDGWHLGPFKDQEFHEALERYKEVFGVHGAFEDRVLEQAQRNPFLLRILFEVARDTNQEHVTFSALKVFEEYYGRLLMKMQDARMQGERIADQTLSAVAQQMYETNADWIDEGRLHRDLNLSVNATLARPLFDHNVLVKRRGGTSTDIGFHFSQLRDFIVCFRALRLPQMDEASFRERVRSNEWNGVQLEALQFYYRYASEEHRRVIDEPLYRAARLYLDFYKEVINRHFPNLKVRFPGCSGSRTGFFGELYLPQRRLRYFGFRDIGPVEPDIVFHPVDNLRSDSNISFLCGVNQRYSWGDLEPDERRIRTMVLRLVQSGLQERILETGGLIEDDTPTLVIDLLLGYIRHAAAGYQAPLLRTALGKFWDDRKRCPRYPIRLDDVEESFRWSEYYRHCEHEYFERKREQLRQRGVDSGGIPCTRDDYRVIEERADEAFRRREPIAQQNRYIDVERTKRWLSEALNILRSHGIDSIEAPVLRNQDVLEAAGFQTDRLDLLEPYVEDLWLAYLRGYKAVVEANFPTLKSSFALYETMPVRVYIAVDSFNVSNPAGRPEVRLGLRIAHVTAHGSENEVVLCRRLEYPRSKGTDFEVFADGERVDALSFHTTSLSYVIFSERRCDPLRLDYLHAPVRKMVYGRIREELPSAFGELFRVYGADQTR